MAIAVNMIVFFILRINLQAQRASKISVNFHCSCKGHFKHLFNKLPPNIFKHSFLIQNFIIPLILKRKRIFSHVQASKEKENVSTHQFKQQARFVFIYLFL